MNKFSKIALTLTILLAFVLRFYKLGEYPPGIDWDEASNAYNAYSILKTGHDEYGNFLPAANRSFDDYKPPLYMYLEIPAVASFQLTPFAARLPSAVLGFLTVPLLYFLSKKLLEDQKSVSANTTAIIAALILAISPWHLQFSRVGFEANTGLFFAVSTVASIFLAFKKSKFLILTALLFSISMYSYHATRIYLPLILTAMTLLWWHQFKKIPRSLYIFAALLIVFLIAPMFLNTQKGAISKRFETTTREQTIEDIEKAVTFINQDKQVGLPFGNIIHNRRYFIGQTLINNYLWHFDFNYLFTTGDDNLRHHIKGIGMLYLWQLPFVIYGVYISIGSRSRGLIFVIAWLLIAPIAAAVAKPAPHAVRSLAMVIPLTILSAIAIDNLKKLQPFPRKSAVILLSAVVIYSLVSYLHDYYTHYPEQSAHAWQYGYIDAAKITYEKYNEFEKINIEGSVEEAYIFWLFATSYDPREYQLHGSRKSFGKYVFDAPAPQSRAELFVSTKRLPDNFETIKTINYPNGEGALYIGAIK